MHEFVVSGEPLRAHGVRALDVAKRLLDYGVHPPTTYFPLIVKEALMIEPTETKSKEELDAFIADVRARDARRPGRRRSCCSKRRPRCRSAGSTRSRRRAARSCASGSPRTSSP